MEGGSQWEEYGHDGSLGELEVEGWDADHDEDEDRGGSMELWARIGIRRRAAGGGLL